MQQPKGGYRWKIVALLFFATTINYIDRQVLGVLAPKLQKTFSWSESDYGLIVSCFQVAYAIGLLISGRVLDRIGVKLGYSIAIVLWSVAGILHAFAGTLFAFAGMRFLLGLAESGNYPAAVKTVAEWFPKKERALATGIFNSGSNIGAIITPIAVPFIALNWGWQMAFVISGALGLLWLVLWRITYKKPELHPRVAAAELAYIREEKDEPGQQLPWSKVVFHRQTLGVSLSLFVTAPIWWFFLYWLPKFLHAEMKLDLGSLAMPLIIIYIVSDIGAIVGGWFSSNLVKKGMEAVKARKLVIFLMALLAVPVFFVPMISNIYLVITFIALATFAHQGYASNVFTIIPDVFPKNAVGSVTGVAMFSASVGGVIFSYFVGWILEKSGSYHLVFGIAAFAYILSWLFLKLLVKNGDKVEIQN